ncbi:hypothetical protein LEN26_006213 [Aphanomyces euteiches]|nr:hypothetical protein AeMF1_001084 [Aphanomyces euteiches]KAH9136348.1 hypothetical protein LEN26_006213 [Aphanomyces euteiches]KAH9195189.1 hypothetical protein AeNC1_002825 [Aphanomyces euteiches]
MGLQVTPSTILVELCTNAMLVERAEAFHATQRLALPDCDFTNGLPYLYVGQGEVGYSFESQPLALVSDDATTCCIVVLSTATYFCLAHIDSDQQAKYLVKSWESFMPSDERSSSAVYVVGGYDDERKIGHGVVSGFLQALKAASRGTYSVELWACGPLNTIPMSSEVKYAQPRSRGALCLLSPSGISLSSVDFAPGTYRGPDFLRRMTSDSSTLLRPLTTRAELEFSLEPYEIQSYLRIDPEEIPGYERWIEKASDSLILSQMSTSPFTEGPKFVPDMKARIQMAIDVARQEIHEETERWFQYSRDAKEWRRVDSRSIQ